ncbi:MAG: M43 family zinc metalloprotease [Bacteroidia bacterium]
MINIRKITQLLFLLSFLLRQNALAQTDDDISMRHCGTYEYNKGLDVKQTMQKLHNHNNAIEEGDKKYVPAKVLGSSDSIFTIPVVVHVVYHTNSENIQDQQIESQIDVLNEDYSGTNLDIVNVPDPFKNIKAGDVGLRFCLATLDADNQPTKGVIRTYTDNIQFDFADDVKSTAAGGDDAWPASKYLNIWVCNLAGSLLGYAQYPGGGPDSTDGVVIFYKAVGRNGTAVKPYNKGRTLTHEVGHWLNLLHVWGDDGGDCTGTDHVGDTPNQAGEHYNCPSYPSISCNNGPAGGDMFMNYLDYTDDSCMCLFTVGQRNRMRNALDNFRDSIKISKQTDCTPLDPKPDYTTIIIPNPNNGNFIIRFKKTIPGSFKLGLYDMLGHQVFTHTESVNESRNVAVQCDYLAKGVYFLRTDVEGHTYNNKVVIFKQ